MRAAAFFDMDGTVISVNSGTQWARHLRKKGALTGWQMLRAMTWIARYKFALIDLISLTEQLTADMEGQSEDDLREECLDWAARELIPYVYPRAHEVVGRHRESGHRVALLTSSSPYASIPLAGKLGIRAEDVLCTRFAVEAGKFTGKVVPPVCAAGGKVTWAERYAAEHGVDLAASYFYTDSYNDLPMLERVGHPVVVNPDPRLGRLARRRKWPIETWEHLVVTGRTA
jgi:HAD superfamily hydrolase (TIGR01490 family)